MLILDDKEVLVKGAVLAMLADTQAAHSIGGFKVGVGFSLRKCRNCLATKENMSVQVYTQTNICGVTLMIFKLVCSNSLNLHNS